MLSRKEHRRLAQLVERVTLTHDVGGSIPLPSATEDKGCICKGNWREIVKECEPLFGKSYKDRRGKIYQLFGVVHADDDYYYGLMDKSGRLVLATCVGSLETNGFTRVDGEQKLLTNEEKLLRSIFGET